MLSKLKEARKNGLHIYSYFSQEDNRHWEAKCQARATKNGCMVLSPACCHSCGGM